jgi:hypothetical protein
VYTSPASEFQAAMCEALPSPHDSDPQEQLLLLELPQKYFVL